MSTSGGAMILAQFPHSLAALLAAPLTAFTATLLVNWWLAGSRLATLTLDHPNRRSLHRSPIPRIGGIGLHAGFLLAVGIVWPDLPPSLWLALAMLLAVSLLNDVREVAPHWRLSVHLAAGAIFTTGVLAEYGLAASVIATLGLAWMANLYNFMDGSDGLAGGMALIGFSFYGAAAAISGSTGFALVNLCIAASSAAFLLVNFHPARIFMGDAGSVPLGFLAAALGILGWIRGDWTWWFPLIVFSPFIIDASVTLARRLYARERVWRPHRDHYYQRLVQLGWGHRGTALAEYVLMLACGAAGIAALAAPDAVQMALLGTVCIAYLALIAAVSRAWHRRRPRTEREAEL